MRFALVLLCSGLVVGLCDQSLGQSQCDKMPLTTVFIESNKNISTAYDNWLCTTDFGSQEDAKNAGIGLTVPVYGVPVTGSGNYSQDDKKEWKKTHCETTHNTLNYAHAYQVLMKLVPPEAYRAWVDCQMLNSRGLACSLEQPSDENSTALMLHTHWNPIKGDKGDNPIVRNSSILGGLSNGKHTVFAQGTNLDAEPTATVIRSPKNSDVVVVVNTNRGSCSGYASATHPVKKAYCDKDPETNISYFHQEPFIPQEHMTHLSDGNLKEYGGDGANHGHEFVVNWTAPGPIIGAPNCHHLGASEEIPICRVLDDGVTAQAVGWINGQGGQSYIDVSYKMVCYLPVEPAK